MKEQDSIPTSKTERSAKFVKTGSRLAETTLSIILKSCLIPL
jgi:hypothetical protein